MIKFERTIVQLGFGAVGKSFFEKVREEIKFDENKYFVISRDKNEFEAFINLGGLVDNFIIQDINKDNFKIFFSKYLSEGDLLIDFADTVGTKDFIIWCAENNVMYLNTGEADWPENWYSIFNENLIKNNLKKIYRNSKEYNKYPIVLQHGNNPGLVSHFLKAGIEYIVQTQFKKDKILKKLLKESKFNKIAQILGIRMIHVNDIDLQKVQDNFYKDKLFSTWCVDSFFFEMLSEATINIGTHEKIDFDKECKLLDYKNGFLEFKDLAIDKKCSTFYPNGKFDGFLVPHEETITIAKSLEVEENGEIIYRPTVMFLYSPCDMAKEYFKKYRVGEYKVPLREYPKNCENLDGNLVVRGFAYPKNSEIVYQEKIEAGTEYVGVLILGEKFKPVWVGNRIEKSFLYKNKKDSYWQTPTITPVAMSALSAVCWMIKNKEKGDIYFPDDIMDYKYIIKKAEKYISKTIYTTFDRDRIEEELKIDLSNTNAKDFLLNEN